MQNKSINTELALNTLANQTSQEQGRLLNRYNYLTNIYKTEFENFKNNVEKELGSFPLDVKTEPNLVRTAMEIWYIRLFEKDAEWGYLPDIVE